MVDLSICKTCNNLENVDIDLARKRCQNCKKSKVYKFDLILELSQKKEFKGKGKSATLHKKYGVAICNLFNLGKSQREIANTLGISPTSVNKYLKNFQS